MVSHVSRSPFCGQNTQDPNCVIEMTAAYAPTDQTNGLAAVGETIVYSVLSTNNGNVDVKGVTVLDTVGGL